MTGPGDPFVHLVHLHRKLAAHWERVSTQGEVRCGPGCVSCCFTDLTVCRVEADFILRGVSEHGLELRSLLDATPGDRRGLSNGLVSQVSAGGPPEKITFVLGPPAPGTRPCPFLSSPGTCAIYELRPIICRTHGVPILADGRRDVCPANKPGTALVAPLNLEWLNTTLFAIDQVYCREQGRPPARVSLTGIAQAVAR